jgi:hypothetical protein
MAVLFNLALTGSGSVGTEAWIKLGVIPTGYRYWAGSATWTAISKALTFELRSNTAGKNTGTTSTTTVMATCAPKVGASTAQDLYQGGKLHIATIKSTGVECWWIRITSKSSTLGNYTYKVLYTQE